MASLIPGFEYDIFISYRQKDNKYDGWVTSFVDNLRRELEATFKDDISIYFDINPHDGLLETHDVEASLKNKLKCLVFIPVVSRTYCDPKSFAWVNEFKVFVEQSSQDQFGLKVKIPNGNVAHRVLPVRIHDLDTEDIKLCESVLGGFLRGVEFIYKEPGVNRSLSPDDDENKNLNKTRYRNQINKVANAIKEIIAGLRAGSDIKEITVPDSGLPWEEAKPVKKIISHGKPPVSKIVKILFYFVSAFIIVLLGVFFYQKTSVFSQPDRLRSDENRVSVAVMPFQNMTNDTTWNIWQDGIQTNLITSLSNSEELKVRQAESINILLEYNGLTEFSKLTPSFARTISQKLDANVFICGSINQSGPKLRLNVQIINSKTKDVLKSFQIEGKGNEIMPVIDTLSWDIRNFLIISKVEWTESKQNWDEFSSRQFASYLPTKSAEAYRYFIYGLNAFNKNDFTASREWNLRALAIDSNFFDAISGISFAFYNEGNNKDGKEWCLKYYGKIDRMSMDQKLQAHYLYSIYFETPIERIKYLNQMIEIDDQHPGTYFNLGDSYLDLFQYEKAIQEFEKMFEILNKWGVKAPWIAYYAELGIAYHKTGQFKKEKKLYRKADRDFPDDPELMDQHAYLELSLGDTVMANRYLEKLISVRKEQSWSDAQIASYLAYIYDMADIPDRVEGYYRKALLLEPENPSRMTSLAYFLIDKDRNINEGMDLIEKALVLRPENINSLHVKGWGLYKQGKYEEALEIMQKSWDLRMKNSIYNHQAFLHLEEVKKVIDRNI